jgi:hypothetical protein
VLVDLDLPNPFAIDPFVNVGAVDQPYGHKFRVFRRTIASPPGVPIFQEGVHDSHVAQIALQLPSTLYESSTIYIETDISAPGFSKREEWDIGVKNGLLKIRLRTPR